LLLNHSLIDFKMAAEQARDAVQNAVQAVVQGVEQLSTGDGSQVNLILDEVTGDRVSKTELKKRQKQREKERQKAEREATRQAPPPPRKKAAGEDEEQLNANVRTQVMEQSGARVTRKIGMT
jgi:lysyl-tRNA synthetase class 2